MRKPSDRGRHRLKLVKEIEKGQVKPTGIQGQEFDHAHGKPKLKIDDPTQPPDRTGNPVIFPIIGRHQDQQKTTFRQKQIDDDDQEVTTNGADG